MIRIRPWARRFGSLSALGVALSCASGPTSGDGARAGEPVGRVAQPLTSSLLRSFSGNDGWSPDGDLLVVGSTLYGVAQAGGAYGKGAVFKIGADGSQFKVLHSFDGGAMPGTPVGSLVMQGSSLYGVASTDGGAECGAVYKVDTTGDQFRILHSFEAGSATNGCSPYGSLALQGSMLYGMTFRGGSSNQGTVFKLDTAGGNFTVLRSFAGGGSDGAYPYGSLLVDGSTLYGMTSGGGGGTNSGTVFKLETDGTGFALLHSFAGYPSDGKNPEGSLLKAGSTLYGMTLNGGGAYVGTVFKLDVDGQSFALLHSFAGSPNDGEAPLGSLLKDGSTLYGMTKFGGANDRGTVFKLDTSGNGFELLRSFAGGAGDGRRPYGSLAMTGSTLYGMTNAGGAADLGTVFKIILLPCAANEHVSNHACVACEPGTTRPADDDSLGEDTSCTPIECVENERVSNHDCVACEPGSTRPAGDLATGADTICTPTVCAANERVSNHDCVACEPGSTRPAGDLTTSADTICAPTLCGANQRVLNHTCVACTAGTTHPAGTSAMGGNTDCTTVVCGVDQYVYNHVCTPCAPGGTRPAGDVATGANTACDSEICGIDEHVAGNACTPCAAGSTRAAGDLATGDDTACAATSCAENEHVADNACAPCAPGSTRAAGDLATGDDTACAAISCAENEHVSNHACVACAPGSTRAAGDLATGEDTACAVTPADDGGAPPQKNDAGSSSGDVPSSSSSSGSDAPVEGDEEPADDTTSGSADEGGCSVGSAGSRRSTPAGFVAFGAFVLAGLGRRRRASHGST